MSAYVKTPKHSLHNNFKIWNIDEKKKQKMEVSKVQYFALVNFNVIICVETFLATLSTNCFNLVHTQYASIRSSCIYEDVNYPFENDLYIKPIQ